MINAWYKWSCDSIYLMLGFIVTITVIYVMPLLPFFEELATHTVDTSRCGVTCQWLHHLVCVHGLVMAQLVVVKASCSYTVQNKHWLISIDMTINSYREFEFTIKTMIVLLSERFTHHHTLWWSVNLSHNWALNVWTVTFIKTPTTINIQVNCNSYCLYWTGCVLWLAEVFTATHTSGETANQGHFTPSYLIQHANHS